MKVIISIQALGIELYHQDIGTEPMLVLFL